MTRMLDHVSIQCSDVAKSLAFYDAVLPTLGGARIMDFGAVVGYGVPPQKVELIHNAYHGPLRFDATREDCRRRLSLPQDRVVLLTICRLMIWKGVDGLIRALKELHIGFTRR